MTKLNKLTFNRFFTTGKKTPFEEVDWELRDAIIGKLDNPVFEQRGVLFPKFWSQNATNIVADKYFRGRLGTPQREKSVEEMITRVVSWYKKMINKDEYCSSKESADIFADELTHLLLNQKMAFNSPVWFNVGLKHKETPRVSACFILDVEDSMESILNWYVEEGLIFKEGSGAGVNLSKLRGSGEYLTGGGKSSGPVSFMRGADASAGAIKSSGACRRSAKMVVLNDSHPDVEEFIACKAHEEKKARVLKQAGFDIGVAGADSISIQYQNANNSVACTDAFFKACDTDDTWELKAVKTGEVMKTMKARDLLRQIAQCAWACADPGVFYIDTMNKWHTSPAAGPIVATNPCINGSSLVLTKHGMTQIKDINLGEKIWSKAGWVAVVNKVCTGVKPVYRYSTTAGCFEGTTNHNIIINGNKIEVDSSDCLEIVKGPKPSKLTLDNQDIIDGLVIGDGTNDHGVIKLNIGQNDLDIYKYLGSFIHTSYADRCKNRTDVKAKVTTTITVKELPATYNRTIPERFYLGSKSRVAGFLKGLYSANGSICDNRITLKATSLKVINQVQVMLSSLGIASYYTTNKPTTIKHNNGEYTSKQSYDLNITKDRNRFAKLIGFIQDYKCNKLKNLVSGMYKTPQAYKAQKVVYDIISREYLGDEEVYDITVDHPDHEFWCSGIRTANCGEFVRQPNTSCNLASIRLTKFIDPENKFDIRSFAVAVNTTLTAMDASVTNAEYPTTKIRDTVAQYRELGLGYTDLGALLMQWGIPYDSDKGRATAAALTALMAGYAWLTSAKMAQAVGPYPGWKIEENAKAHIKVMKKHLREISKINAELLDQPEIINAATQAWEEAITLGTTTGYRNAQTTLLAPTGTISFLMDADTTGIEPDLALVKYKKLSGGGAITIINQSVPKALNKLGYDKTQSDAIIDHILKENSVANAPYLKHEHKSVFDVAIGKDTIHYSGHVKMLAAVIPFLCGSISKTVNMPESATVEEVEQLIMDGWRLGLKNIAIFRDKCKADQPLNVTDNSAKTTERAPVPVPRQKLPKKRHGTTTSFSINGCDGYIQTGEYPNGELGEVFMKVAKQGSTMSGLMDAFAIAVSLGLQHGVPLEAFVQKYINTKFEPAGITDDPDFRFASSIVDYLFKRLAVDYLDEQQRQALNIKTVAERTHDLDHNIEHKLNPANAPLCLTCGATTQPAGSCYVCNSCGSTSGCS